MVTLGFDNPVPTLRALDICMQQAWFGDALLLSSQADEFELADCRMLPVETHSLIFDALLPQLRTDHVLLVAVLPGVETGGSDRRNPVTASSA